MSSSGLVGTYLYSRIRDVFSFFGVIGPAAKTLDLLGVERVHFCKVPKLETVARRCSKGIARL